MKNFIQRGDIINVTAVAPVTAGDVVEIGAFLGVAVTSAAIGENFALDISNVFELPKDGSVYLSGDPVFWDGSQIVQGDGGGANSFFGMVTEAAGAPAAKVRVLIGSHIAGNLVGSFIELAQKLDIDTGVTDLDYEANTSDNF